MAVLNCSIAARGNAFMRNDGFDNTAMVSPTHLPLFVFHA
jgi:hypothetical protein